MQNVLEKDTSEMGLTEFKRLLHGQMQATLLEQYHDYLEAVTISDDPEVKRKCVALHISTIGAEHKEKVDPNANLQVFQFNFTSTGMTATQLPTVERVEPAQDMATLSFDNLATVIPTHTPVDDGLDQVEVLDADELMAPWED